MFDVPALRVDSAALRGLLPPAAMGHALAELRERNQIDRLDDVETEARRVRAELGHPPLVTPIIEIVATQAVYNVCDGDRYATVSQEVKDYCLGLYGSPPYPVDAEVRRLVNGREEPITCRPADLLEPALPALRRELEREGVEGRRTTPPWSASRSSPPRRWRCDAARWSRSGSATSRRRRSRRRRRPDDGDAPPAADGRAPSDAAAAEVRELTVEVDGQSYSVRVIGAGRRLAAAAAAAAHRRRRTAPVAREGTVVAPDAGPDPQGGGEGRRHGRSSAAWSRCSRR